METEKYYANKNIFNPIDSVCVVTGGSSGIGVALIKSLIKKKAKKVINIDIKKNNISEIDFHSCDVGNNKEVEKTLSSIYKKYNHIDLFCSNAGIFRADDAFASAEHWDKVIKTNILQHANIVRHCMSNMIVRKKGWFLITGSAAGLLSQVGSATYSTTKHATIGFAEWLAITYGDKNIGVSVLCPQAVKTPMTENIKNGGVAGIDGMLEADFVANFTLDQMALGKFLITPHEIVNKYIKNKAANPEKWIIGMRKLYKKFVSER